MMQVTVSVPGKVMLAGEYAVLNGGSTLSATISGAMTIILKGTGAPGTKITSSIWPDDVHLAASAQLDDFAQDPLCQSIIAGRKQYGINVNEVSVASDLDLRHGVGTSSAIRLGILLGMRALAGKDEQGSEWAAARTALNLQKMSQPDASGYDIATQLIGGLVRLDFEPRVDTVRWFAKSEQLAEPACTGPKEKLHVFVGGKGAPTAQVMKNTLQWMRQNDLQQEILLASERLVSAMNLAFFHNDGKHEAALYAAMGQFRQLFSSAPDFPQNIANKIATCTGCDKHWSFKTTGAGGEDAILVAGRSENLRQVFDLLTDCGWHPMPYTFSPIGTTVEVKEWI